MEHSVPSPYPLPSGERRKVRGGFILYALCSLFFFQEVEDGPVDHLRGFPHGDVAALLNDEQFRTLDGLMEVLPNTKRKDEIFFPPDKESGVMDTGKVVYHF